MRRALPWVTGGCGVLLVAAGLVLYAAGRNLPPAGWVAYTPLQSGMPRAYADYLPVPAAGQWSVWWTPPMAVGAGVTVLGLLLLAGLGGWLLGRRGAPRQGPARPG